jgi:polysaccharide biosynthesis/export protein
MRNWMFGILFALALPLTAQVEPAGANLPSQPIGATDLLAISVYGAPELTRTVRVSAEGLIRLPMLSERIDVRGMLPAELEERLAAALEREQILVEPAVTVTIAEYHSRPISVAGAVKSPLTFQALGKTSLLEALTRAQGFSEDAGAEILVTRPGPAGEAPVTERIPRIKLIDAADPQWNILLEGGEEIRVPQMGRVFVVGNVKKPGAFQVDPGGQTSVLKALAMAEGLAPYATSTAYIYRPADGTRTEVTVALRKIMDRKSEDVVLAANDILYVPVPTPKGAVPEIYFHFDSWRVNTGGAAWAPAQIYVEEEGAPGQDQARSTPRFKAQSRIWDYTSAVTSKTEELTSILIESEAPVHDQDTPKDVSPLESQRAWERQAEDNLLARLEKGGLLAPPGPVDDVLNTVVNNLIVAAKLGVETHCRVLLTTPIESFVVGHTIVVSRGLIDVLPDETSLALALAGELSHIALGHPAQTQFAFNNQTMLSDPELLQRFRFRRSPEEVREAARKTVEIMRASPYRNTAGAGLFLKALASRVSALPRLLEANLGDQVADPDALKQLAEFAASAPAFDEAKIEQIAALPLGSRVKLNPWNNHIELVQTRPLSLLSAREKMPFEVTPFVLYLTRVAK